MTMFEKLIDQERNKCSDGTQSHHYVIDTPTKGERTKGVCKKCGMVMKRKRKKT